jgi:hypothetical protein
MQRLTCLHCRHPPAGADEVQEEMPGCHAPDLSEMEGTKDFYLLSLSLLISLCTSAVTVYKLADQGVKPHLLMVLFWGVYNMIPPFLFIMYTCYRGEPPCTSRPLLHNAMAAAHCNILRCPCPRALTTTARSTPVP